MLQSNSVKAGSYSAPHARKGISAVEFVGAFAALAGGVVIGSMYLGVDVKATASRLLRQASAAPATNETKSAAEQERPTEPAPASDSAATKAPVEPPAAVDAPATPAVAAPRSASLFTDGIELTEEQRQKVTKAYWQALDGLMKAEVDHRTAGLKAGGNWELYDYLSARSEGHRTAAEAIAQLDAVGIDSHIIAYGKKALAWHEEGAKLYARAKDLLTDAPTAQLSGPFAQSWQSAATQHQMEERLLAEKRTAVDSYLEHQKEPATSN
jgi:hypothetical protein